MTSVTLPVRSLLGFKLIRKRPLFNVVLVPSTPMKEDRLTTSGSLRTMSARARWRSAMVSKDPLDQTGVLNREKALGNDYVKTDSDAKRDDGDGKRQRLAVQHPSEQPAIFCDHAIEPFGGLSRDAAMLLVGFRMEKFGAHHR